MARRVLLLALSVACGGPPQPVHVAPPDQALPAQPSADGATPGKGFRTRGRWRKAPAAGDDRVQELLALGYAEATGQPVGEGVWQAEDASPWGEAMLVTSGHLAGAVLLDLQGKELHRWQATWGDLQPSDTEGAARPMAHTWRRAVLVPDGSGDILAVFEGLGIARLDRHSQPVWVVANGAHHEAEVVGETVWTLVRQVAVLPSVHPDRPVLEDGLAELDLATGAVRRSVSLVTALNDGGFGPVTLADDPEHEDDLLHANGIERLTRAGAHPAMQPGRWLVSLLATDQVVVLDPDAARVVHHWRGPWRRQHDPHVVSVDGHDRLSVFDNQWQATASRVVAIDPRSGEPTWQWPDKPRPEAFFTKTCGLAEPLPGGGWLLVESDVGRVTELDAAARPVWRWHAPYRAGPGDRWVATVFQAQRLAALPAWLP